MNQCEFRNAAFRRQRPFLQGKLTDNQVNDKHGHLWLENQYQYKKLIINHTDLIQPILTMEFDHQLKRVHQPEYHIRCTCMIFYIRLPLLQAQ